MPRQKKQADFDSDVLLRSKPVNALVSLRDKGKTWYASLVAKKIDCTYPHTIKILKEFERAGFVSEEHKGRTNILRLTDKGEEVAKTLETLLRQLKKA
ncbi:MAG TPA: winged helix DNA-binding protein [archaeon]|nr:winged helix DNA-binding protein [archaeon]HLD81149.1 winged helix DNA-binding protein [archaeon]